MTGDPDGGDDDRGRGEDAERPAGGTDADGGASGRDGPLADLAERLRRSRSRRPSGRDGRAGEGADQDPFAVLERDLEGDGAVADPGTPTDPDDPFERVEVGDVDEEAVWASLESGESSIDRPAVGTDAERVERDDPDAERPDHVVRKSAYCQRCRFLSDPPAVRCAHEGTTIVEVVDSGRFRVRGCPMVAQGGAVDRGSGADRDGGRGREETPD